MHAYIQACKLVYYKELALIILSSQEEFPYEAQSRDYVQQEVSCALDEDNTRGPFQCMQGWKDELL